LSDIQVISGTRRAMKEMADGTLRVQIDIDPRFRAAFFAAFGQIDMPVAIAPLVADFEKRAPEPEKAKGGPLARLAGMWSNEQEFWNFSDSGNAEEAAEWIREICLIESRAELDNSLVAKQNFEKFVRGPYMKYRAQRNLP
jgi:hypothetical protein